MRLRVLTYNIHKAIGVDREFCPERIVAVLGHYDADVVLLQEVDRGVPRSDHLDLASHLAGALRYGYRAVAMNVFLEKGRYGNATLSRYPIERQHNLDLSVGRRKRRGAQHTRIRIPRGPHPLTVDVFNVHLGLLPGERLEQVQRLLAAHDLTNLHPERACIIGGDMNDWAGVLKRRRFQDVGFVCATDRPGSRWSIKTWPSYAPTTGLDKVFYRGPLRLLHAHHSRLALARVASDHLPVVVDFELRSHRL